MHNIQNTISNSKLSGNVCMVLILFFRSAKNFKVRYTHKKQLNDDSFINLYTEIMAPHMKFYL